MNFKREAAKALGAFLEGQVTELVGKIDSVYPDEEEQARFPGLYVLPDQFTFAPFQEDSLGSAAPVNEPAAPTVTIQGAAGGTSYSYAIVAKGKNAQASAGGPATAVATGNAALNGTNFNRVSWTAVPGATGYDVYRTASGGTPSSIGKIGSTTSATFDDVGLAGNAAALPTINTTKQDNIVDLGCFEGTMELRLACKSLSERERLEAKVLGAFFSRELSPGVVVAQITNAQVGGLYDTSLTATCAFALEDEDWREELVFSKKRFSSLTVTAWFDAWALRSPVYDANTMISALTEDMTSNAPSTEQVQVAEDGSLTSA